MFEELPVDEQDNPLVDISVSADNNDTGCVVISFDKMLRMNKKEEWERLFGNIAKKQVYIRDDVNLKNEEMAEYKAFYLQTYFYNLSKHCNGCNVGK
jgi:hypothetical protein